MSNFFFFNQYNIAFELATFFVIIRGVHQTYQPNKTNPARHLDFQVGFYGLVSWIRVEILFSNLGWVGLSSS